MKYQAMTTDYLQPHENEKRNKQQRPLLQEAWQSEQHRAPPGYVLLLV